MQLDGDDADRIPDTATARILPTTLFGQKYVELTSPADPGDGHVVDGTVLRAAPDSEPVELTRVLDHLEVVLGSVQPQRLSSMLQAVSYGLDGQGGAVAELIDGGGSYLVPSSTSWRRRSSTTWRSSSRSRTVRRRRTRPPRACWTTDHDHGDDYRGHPLARGSCAR